MGVEGGNFYEDAIIREQNLVELQDERSAIDERLQEPDTNHGQQEVGESSEINSELQSQVDFILGRFEGLAEKEGLSGIDVFKEFIINANDEVKQLFIDRTNSRNIKNTVEASGRFPVNEFEFQQSIIEGSVLSTSDQLLEEKSNLAEEESLRQLDESNLAEEESLRQLEESELAEEEASRQLEEAELLKSAEILLKLHRFNESISGLNISNPRLSLLLGNLPLKAEASNQEVINESGKEIAQLLRSNNLIETQILPQAQAQGPEVYRQVVENLAPLHPSFQARIDAWEMTPETFEELPPEQMVRVSGALGTGVDDVSQDADKSGNIFTIDGVDGTQVSYDVVTNERSVTLDGYTIEANADDPGDYQTPKLVYMRVEQKQLPKLNMIHSISQALTSKEVDTDDLAEIRATISAIPGVDILGLNFEAMESGEAIQTALSTLFTATQNELDTAREEYRDELIRLRDTHAGVLAARDKRVKSTLSLLQGTGVTQMPQSVFMQVAETVNLAPAEYGFQTQIDLENGILGFDASGDNENVDRVQFAEMVNVMLGVEPGSEYAVNSQAVNGIGNTAISNRNEFNTYVAEESGWHTMGAANTILQRLKNRNTTSQ